MYTVRSVRWLSLSEGLVTPRRNFTKMVNWSRVSEHLVNLIGMNDQLKWDNHQSPTLF